LVLLNSYELFGVIESIEKIRLSNNKRDSLILTFKEARISIIDHDEKRNTLKTVCLYYLEDESLKEGCLEFNFDPIIKVDPKNRCAGLIIYDTKLAIIPFNNESNLIYEKSKENEEIKFERNFIKDLENIKNIKDYNFLEGYFDPTIVILFESEPTTSSRVFLKKNSVSLTAISIDSTKKFPVILNLQNLSYDLYKIIPLERCAFLLIGNIKFFNLFIK
jgi:cleavage and polyadenylation specificity factor subunit 1